MKKNHTCGSLFAKCNCNPSPPLTDGSDASSLASSSPSPSAATSLPPPQRAERRKTLFQSYSHPDTAFVFTDENRNPSRDRPVRITKAQSTPTRTKRLSTPCIGNYTVLDVAVHPEVVLTFSHTNGAIEPRYAETGVRPVRPKPILKKSITFQNDNGYMRSFREELLLRKLSKSLSEGDEQHHHNGRSSFSMYGSGDTNHTYLRPIEKKFSRLTAAATANDDAFEAARQKDNMEYLKYNALGYQQDNQAKQRQMTMQHPDIPSSQWVYDDDRQDSRNLIAPTIANGSIRKTSRSMGDGRVEQLRKQSDCNEGEYLRKNQHRETVELKDEVIRLKCTITERDDEINKLRREIHKLKVSKLC